MILTDLSGRYRSEIKVHCFSPYKLTPLRTRLSSPLVNKFLFLLKNSFWSSVQGALKVSPKNSLHSQKFSEMSLSPGMKALSKGAPACRKTIRHASACDDKPRMLLKKFYWFSRC